MLFGLFSNRRCLLAGRGWPPGAAGRGSERAIRCCSSSSQTSAVFWPVATGLPEPPAEKAREQFGVARAPLDPQLLPTGEPGLLEPPGAADSAALYGAV